MIAGIVVILILLWFLGYGPLDIGRVTLFKLNGHLISLWDILIFGVLVWAVGELPRPFKEIASILLIVWVLSVLGIVAVAGLSNLLVIAVIVGLVIYALGGK